MSVHPAWIEYETALAVWKTKNKNIDPALRDPEPCPPVLLPRSRTPLPGITTNVGPEDREHPQFPHPLPATAPSRRPPAVGTPFAGPHVPEGHSMIWPPNFSSVRPDTDAFDPSFALPPFPTASQGFAPHHPPFMSPLHSPQAHVSLVPTPFPSHYETFAPTTHQDPEHVHGYGVSISPPVQYVSPDVLHSSPDRYQDPPSPDSHPPPPRHQRISSTVVRNSPLPSSNPEPSTSHPQTVALPGRYYLRSTSKAKKTEPLADETNIPGTSGSNIQPKPAAGRKGAPCKTDTEDVETEFGVAVFADERNEKGQAKFCCPVQGCKSKVLAASLARHFVTHTSGVSCPDGCGQKFKVRSEHEITRHRKNCRLNPESTKPRECPEAESSSPQANGRKAKRVENRKAKGPYTRKRR